MPVVSLDQLRFRIAAATERKLEFERQSAIPARRLARHEVWRHAYLRDPYLIGARDDRLAKRFEDVFLNTMELQANGQLGPHDFQKDDSFTQKFTHLLEEYGLRGGIPTPVIASARIPLLRYFENGDPIANKIFAGYIAPKTPLVVKYGKKEHLEPMLAEGRIRICPASYYVNPTHNAAIQDDELRRSFFIPTYSERLAGRTHLDFGGNRIRFDDDDIVSSVPVADYFLFCLCDHVYYRMPTDFDADAALIIKDPGRFSQLLISHFLALNPDWKPLYGPVTYYDPYRDFKKVTVPEMSKHFAYSYQREVRVAFRPPSPLTTALTHQTIKIGSMIDYAKLLSA